MQMLSLAVIYGFVLSEGRSDKTESYHEYYYNYYDYAYSPLQSERLSELQKMMQYNRLLNVYLNLISEDMFYLEVVSILLKHLKHVSLNHR